MLESLITSLLQDIAGKYLDNFDKNMLSISLTKGDVEVRDLSLKAEALQGIHPALKVLCGFVSKIKIVLSFTKLKSVPVQVIIDDILILASPEAEFEFTEENIKHHLEEKLQDKLKLALQAEYLAEESIKTTNKKSKEGGFVSGLLKSIVNNLIVKIYNVHVRVEDSKQNFCFGISIGAIMAHSVKLTKENGKTVEYQCFIAEDEKSYIKRISVDNLALYADTGFVPLSASSDKKYIKAYLRDKIATKANEEFNYIIYPISSKLLFQFQDRKPGEGFMGPRMAISLTLSGIDLSISMYQLSCILNYAYQFARKSDVGLIQYRPDYALEPSWWSYLLASAEEEEYENKLMYATYIRLFSRHYIQLMYLPKKAFEEFDRVSSACLPSTEAEVFKVLNSQFTLKEINYCRYQVLDEIVGQNYKYLAKKQYELVFTQDEVLQRLQAHCEKPPKDVLPKDFIILNVQLKMDAITLGLTSKTTEKAIYSYKSLPYPIGKQFLQKYLLQLAILNIYLKTVMKSEDKISLQASIDSLQLLDFWNQNTQFPIILRPLPSDRTLISNAIRSRVFENTKDDQFMKIAFEKPGYLDKDMLIQMTVQPLAFVFTYYIFQLLQQIMNDAKVLQNEQQSNYIVTYLANNVYDQFSKIQNYSKNAIELAVKNHLTMDIETIISAPVVICPSINRQGSYLVANFGNLIVRSLDEQTAERIYDNYVVTLQNMCIFTADGENELVRMFYNQHKLNNTDFAETAIRNVILYPFCAVVKVKYCFLPNYLQAERLNLDAHMQDFVLNINDVNTALLILLLQRIMAYTQSTDPKIVEVQQPSRDTNREMLRQLGECSEIQTSAETSESVEVSHGLTAEFRLYTSREQIAQYVLTHAEVRFDKLGIVIGVLKDEVVRPVISAAISGIKCSFLQRPYRNNIGFSVFGFLFEDNLHEKQIIQTRSGEQLFELQMVYKTKRDPTYSNVDMDIYCSVGNISFQYYPDLVSVVMLLQNQLIVNFAPLMTQREKIVITAEQASLDLGILERLACELVRTAKNRTGVYENHYYMRLHFVTHTFSVKVSDSTRVLCEFQLLNSVIDFDMMDKQKAIAVQCKGMQLVDFYEQTQHKYVLAFIPSENEQIVFAIRLVDPKSVDFCGYATEIIGSITVQLKITVMLRFVQNMLEFATQQMQKAQPLVDDGKATESTGKQHEQTIPSLMKLEFFMIAPKVVLPLNDKCSDIAIEMDMGQLYVSSNYYMGSMLDDEYQLPLAGFVVQLSNFQIVSSTGQQFLNPVGAEVTYYAPIVCQSSEKAIQSNIHPRTCIRVEFKQKIELGLRKSDYQLLMYFLWSENNLGFNIVDTKYADDREFLRLRELIMSYKEKNAELMQRKAQETDVYTQLETLRAKNIRFDVEKAKPVLEARKRLLDRQKQYKTENTGYSLKADVYFRGLSVAMCDSAGARLAFDMSGVNVQFATKSSVSHLHVQLHQLSLADMQATQAPAILRTTAPLDVHMKLAEHENALTVDSKGEIRICYVETPVQFVLQFINIENEKQSPEFATNRRHCLRMYEKCNKMQKFIDIQKESAKFLAQNADITTEYRQSLIKSQATFTAFQYANIENSSKTKLDIKLPTISISAPEDATRKDSYKILLEVHLTLKGQLLSSVKQKNSISGKMLFYKEYSATQVTMHLNRLALYYWTSEEQHSDIFAGFSMSVKLDLNQTSTLIKGSKPFLRKDSATGVEVNLENNAHIDFTHEQLAFVMRMIESVYQTLGSANPPQDAPEQPVQLPELDSQNSQTESTLSTDYGLKELCDIKQFAYQDLIDANVVSKNATFEKYAEIGQLEFPVFYNSGLVKFAFQTTRDLYITLIDDRAGLRPILRLICICKSVDMQLNSVYDVPDASQMHLAAELAVQVQHYNVLQRKYENILAPVTISAALNDEPQVDDQTETARNLKTIDLRLPKLQVNFSALIYGQMLQIAQFFEEFSRDTNQADSIYYSQVPKLHLVEKREGYKAGAVFSNMTNANVTVDYQGVGPYKTLDLALTDDAIITLVLLGYEFKFHVQDGEYYHFVIEQIDYYMHLSVVEQRYVVYLRHRFVITSECRIPIIFSAGDSYNAERFSTASSQVSVRCDGTENILSMPAQDTPVMQVGDKYFRVSCATMAISDYYLYDLRIEPTFIICNECLTDLSVNGFKIAPLTSMDMFINPYGQPTLEQIEMYAFSRSNLQLATQIYSPPSLSDTTEDAKRLRKEFATSQLVYKFIREIVLSSDDGKRQYYLGVKREMPSTQDTRNPFGHKLIVFPYYILRNCFAINGFASQVELRMLSSKKSKADYSISAFNGEYVQLGLPECSVSDFVLTIDKKQHVLVENILLNKQVNTVTNETTDLGKFYFKLAFQFAYNNLSKVITLFPGRLIRNFTENEIFVLFGELPFDIGATNQMIITPGQTRIVLSQFKYLFVYNERYVSCAVNTTAVDSNVLQFKDGKAIAVQVMRDSDMFVIDFFDATGISVLEVVNKSQVDLTIQQLLDIRPFVKSGPTPLPSIKKSTPHECPMNSKLLFNLDDISMPPYLNISYQQESFQLSLTKFGKRKPYTLCGYLFFTQLDVKQERRVLIISNKPVAEDTLIQKAQKQLDETKVYMKLNLCVEDLVVSVYDLYRVKSSSYLIPHEVLRFQLSNMLTCLFQTPETTAITAQVHQITLSNPQKDAEFVSVLDIGGGGFPSFSLQAEKINNTYQFSGVTLYMAPISVNVDQSLCETAMRFVGYLGANQLKHSDKLYDSTMVDYIICTQLLPRLNNPPNSALNLSQTFIGALYLSDLCINLNVSLHDLTFLQSNLFFSLLNVFGSVLTNLQNANLKFSQFGLKAVFASNQRILDCFITHYKSQIMRNMFYILKSASFLGAMQGSSSTIKQSSIDLFQGDAFADRLRGVAGIGKSLIAGYGGAINGVAGTFSGVLGALSFDPEYVRIEYQRLRGSHASVGSALKNAGLAAGTGVLEGIVGIVSQPIRGGREEGAKGVFKGIGRGLAGIFTKPVAGLANAVSNVGVAIEVGAVGGHEERAITYKVWHSGVIDCDAPDAE